MARPKKDKILTNSHLISFRLTDTQYQVISETARQANLSLSEYIPTGHPVTQIPSEWGTASLFHKVYGGS